MAKIPEMGGIVKAISAGYIQKEVARQACEFEKGLQSGDLIKIRINKYTGGKQGEVALHEYSDKSAIEQIKSLKELRRTSTTRRLLDHSRHWKSRPRTK